MLSIKIYVFEVRKDEIQQYQYIEIGKPIATICLLFYENHYDIIEKNENIQAENSVILGSQDYYSAVSENMAEGVCIECGNHGYVYDDSGLCFKCHEASLSSLKNFSKDAFKRGKCGQCYKTK